MQILPLHPHIRADDLSLEQLARNQKVSEEEKVRELSRQFEAVLLRQILRSAQKTVIKSDLTSESAASGIYQDMVTEQLAQAISKSGSLGFAQSLERELTRQLLRTQSVSEDRDEK